MATYAPEFLDVVENLDTKDWQGRAWRHMFNNYTPDRVNTNGARWNPPGVGAIYTSFDRATALAEGQHAVDVQPRRTPARRVLYEIRVPGADLIDLTVPGAMHAVGVDFETDVQGDNWSACQLVGGAAAWLGRGGLIVPSARAPGKNLVILVGAAAGPDNDLTILSRETVQSHPHVSPG